MLGDHPASYEFLVIVQNCSVGHSGGPCVNDDGFVVGILSRADPADHHRCYLVPAGQVKSLVRKARGLCSRPVYTTTPNTATTPTNTSRVKTL